MLGDQVYPMFHMLLFQFPFAASESSNIYYVSVPLGNVSKQPGFGKLNLLLSVCCFCCWCNFLAECEAGRLSLLLPRCFPVKCHLTWAACSNRREFSKSVQGNYCTNCWLLCVFCSYKHHWVEPEWYINSLFEKTHRELFSPVCS